jgi:N-methylhydantoinase A
MSSALPLGIHSAEDMRTVIDEFEAVYAKVNHRVSRYGGAGFRSPSSA